MYFLSISLGLILVISSLFLIRYELNRALHTKAQIIEQSKVYKEEDLFNLLESMQVSIDEMNRAFYDIAADLEGKYSVHEKEIQDLQKLFIELKKLLETAQKSHEVEEVTLNKANDQINFISESPKIAIDLDIKESKRLEVHQLKRQGKSASQIARDLDMGIGEVQLLLKLNR
jgi:hypothetical protein